MVAKAAVQLLGACAHNKPQLLRPLLAAKPQLLQGLLRHAREKPHLVKARERGGRPLLPAGPIPASELAHRVGLGTAPDSIRMNIEERLLIPIGKQNGEMDGNEGGI